MRVRRRTSRHHGRPPVDNGAGPVDGLALGNGALDCGFGASTKPFRFGMTTFGSDVSLMTADFGTMASCAKT